VDVASNPLRDRSPAFAMVEETMAPYVAGPLVVVGDFDTPRESVRFDSWRGPLVHAFEAAGSGWAPTWPVPLPVLALDHVWLSRSLTVRSCEHLWTTRSDHRPVAFTFD
jgi:endonuclease/exonuclease/phosphatase family metal-dependent hydrolase